MKTFVLKNLISLACIIISVVWVVLGLLQFGFWESGSGPMAGFFPVIVAGVLLLISVVNLFSNTGKKVPVFNKDSFILIAAFALVLLGCYIVGAVVSLLAFLFVWIKFYEKSSWLTTIKVMVLLGAIIYGIFIAWLGISFPTGILFSMFG